MSSNRDLEFILRFKNEASKTLQAAKKDLDALGKEAKDVALQAQLLAKSGIDVDKAFSAVSKQAATVSAQLKGMEASGTGAGAALANVSRQTKVASTASKEMAAAGTTVQSVWAGVRNILLTIGGISIARRAISELAGFESQMQQVRAVAGGTRQDFEALREAALSIGGASQYGAQGAAAALKELAKAGFTAREAVGALPGTLDLAAAGGLDIARASEIASTSVRQFNLQVTDTAHVADVFAESANRTNADVTDMAEAFKTVGSLGANMKESLESTAAAIGILSNSGVKGGEAGTNLRNTLVGLIAPSAQVRETLLGLTNAVTGQALKLRDVNPAYHSLSEILKVLGSAATDATVAAKIFDARNVNAVGILARNVNAMDELEQRFKNAQGAAKEMAAVMTNSLVGSFNLLSSTIGEIVNRFGESSGLRKGMKEFLDTANIGLRILNGTFNDSEEAVQAYASRMGVAAVEVRRLFEGARELADNIRILGQAIKIAADLTAGLAVAFATVKVLQFSKDFLFAKVAVDAFGASIVVAESGIAGAALSAGGLGARMLAAVNPITAVAAVVGTLVAGLLLFNDTAQKSADVTDDYEGNVRRIIGTTKDYTEAVKELTQAERDRLEQESLLGRQSAFKQMEDALKELRGGALQGLKDDLNDLVHLDFSYFRANLTAVRAAFQDTQDVERFRKELTALSLAFPDHAEEVRGMLQLLDTYDKGADKAENFNKILEAIAEKNKGISEQTGEVKKTEGALDDAAEAAKRLASALDLAFNRQSGDLGIKLANINAQLAAVKTGGKSALEALKQQQQAEDEFFKNYASANPDAGIDNVVNRKALLENPTIAKNLALIKEQAAAVGQGEAALQKYLETSKKNTGQEERFNLSLAEKIATMHKEASVIGQTDVQRKRSLELFKVEQEALKAGIKNFDISEYAKAYDDMIEAQKAAQRDFFGGMKTAIGNFIENAKTAADVAADVFNDIVGGVEDAIDGMVDGSINSFKDLKAALGKILQQIAADIIKYLFISQLVNPLLSSIGFGVGSGGGSTSLGSAPFDSTVYGGSFLPNAKGNAFMNGMKLQAFAKGGVVNTPTLFNMQNGVGLTGEAGAEAIMPLKRLSNGSLGVQASSASGASGIMRLSYSAEFNIDMRGNNSDGGNFTPEQQKMLGDVINNAVKATVIETLQDQQRNGGVLRNNRVVQ